MVRHRGTVLVDTNVILEAHRTGSWRALTGGYAVETVEDCVTETRTGFQRRRPERRIDQAELRERLAAVHAVGDLERAGLAIRAGEIALDRGESSLWAHTPGRDDDWMLCGPDKASLRFGVRHGYTLRRGRFQRWGSMRTSSTTVIVPSRPISSRNTSPEAAPRPVSALMFT